MAQHQLAAKVRETTGKEAAKKMRREKLIPGVFYGPESEPIMVSFKDGDLRKILKTTASENIIMGLQLETDKGTETKTVILKGTVYGNIKATEKLEIHLKGKLFGNIKTAKLKIADGVVFEGNCEMIKKDGKSTLEKSAVKEEK